VLFSLVTQICLTFVDKRLLTYLFNSSIYRLLNILTGLERSRGPPSPSWCGGPLSGWEK